MIKTWQQRCEEHPDHDGIVSDGMIQARMQEEIDELRAALNQAQQPPLQVSPLMFTHMVLDKEHVIGKPIFWAEWPNKEKNT
jgi:hypothetical protein